jgi:catechol 2,3-dioxygenase-like lactoylglutathione lyase family enzyme
VSGQRGGPCLRGGPASRLRCGHGEVPAHDGRSYDLGRGYGHIAVGVDDLDATLERLAAQGIEPERPPYSVREGGSRLCFVQDPDS